MGSQESHPARAFVLLLANEAKRLQREARVAIDQGNYTRASTLLGDAELLAEDVHLLVTDIERREIGELITLDAYDVRDVAQPNPPREQPRFTISSRRLRMAIGTGLVMSVALTEW